MCCVVLVYLFLGKTSFSWLKVETRWNLIVSNLFSWVKQYILYGLNTYYYLLENLTISFCHTSYFQVKLSARVFVYIRYSRSGSFFAYFRFHSLTVRVRFLYTTDRARYCDISSPELQNVNTRFQEFIKNLLFLCLFLHWFWIFLIYAIDLRCLYWILIAHFILQRFLR